MSAFSFIGYRRFAGEPFGVTLPPKNNATIDWQKRMSKIDVITGDNLEALWTLAADGAKFDLIELDGPYGANLEDWDKLTEAEYLRHYADRLALVREVLHPWGVVFLFGWPEGCAEIKAWAHRTGTLHLRRWISWFVNSSAHAARKIQTILVLVSWRDGDVVSEFR